MTTAVTASVAGAALADVADAALSEEERTARRHALVERMLVDLVGVPWDAVHREADSWAESVSDTVEDHIVDVLGDPGTCPHGNPIPGSSNAPDQSHATPLDATAVGPIRIVRIAEEVEDDDETMALLARAGLVPGAECEIVGAVESGGVAVAGAVADAVVPGRAAAGVWVEAH